MFIWMQNTVIPLKLAIPNSRNPQTRGFCYLVAWKPPNRLFTIKMAPYLAVSKFAVPYYPTPKIREFGGITVLIFATLKVQLNTANTSTKGLRKWHWIVWKYHTDIIGVTDYKSFLNELKTISKDYHASNVLLFHTCFPLHTYTAYWFPFYLRSA